MVLLWILWTCGAPCGCGVSSKLSACLLIGLALSTIVTLALWLQGSAALFLGSHGQAYVCEPLYDHPNYTCLGEMVDPGGLFEEGIVERLLGVKDATRIKDLIE